MSSLCPVERKTVFKDFCLEPSIEEQQLTCQVLASLILLIKLCNICMLCVCVCVCVCSVAQSYPTVCNPMDCSQPGSSVHGISQARTLERAAISYSRVSSQPRDRTCISCIASRFFTTVPPGKPHVYCPSTESKNIW